MRLAEVIQKQALNVFSSNDEPYLRSIKDGNDPFCSIAPNFEWEETYSDKTFLERLKTSGYDINSAERIIQIKINNRFPSGRVDELEIDLSGGETVKLYGNKIRSIIRTADNRSILRSTLFNIYFNNSEINIIGKGNGHGVGLCQWGSIGMSQKGYDYKYILSHYFPGTKIMRYNDRD